MLFFKAAQNVAKLFQKLSQMFYSKMPFFKVAQKETEIVKNSPIWSHWMVVITKRGWTTKIWNEITQKMEQNIERQLDQTL